MTVTFNPSQWIKRGKIFLKQLSVADEGEVLVPTLPAENGGMGPPRSALARAPQKP